MRPRRFYRPFAAVSVRSNPAAARSGRATSPRPRDAIDRQPQRAGVETKKMALRQVATAMNSRHPASGPPRKRGSLRSNQYADNGDCGKEFHGGRMKDERLKRK